MKGLLFEILDTRSGRKTTCRCLGDSRDFESADGEWRGWSVGAIGSDAPIQIDEHLGRGAAGFTWRGIHICFELRSRYLAVEPSPISVIWSGTRVEKLDASQRDVLVQIDSTPLEIGWHRIRFAGYVEGQADSPPPVPDYSAWLTPHDWDELSTATELKDCMHRYALGDSWQRSRIERVCEDIDRKVGQMRWKELRKWVLGEVRGCLKFLDSERTISELRSQYGAHPPILGEHRVDPDLFDERLHPRSIRALAAKEGTRVGANGPEMAALKAEWSLARQPSDVAFMAKRWFGATRR